MRRAYRVTGRVQGVGFRWFVRQSALRLDLRGSARNAPEGHVEVVAEGDEAGLDELERVLRQGPPTARVDDVALCPAPEGPLPHPFEIAR